MPDSVMLTKAEMRELDAEFKNEINKEKWATVQFNPETLKVSYANQIATPSGTGDQKGTPARLFVGAGTTKLSLQLWFDVNANQGDQKKENDVRKLTQKIAYFITPQQRGDTIIPPAVRFLWGSFQFDGIIDSLEESLEFFSHEGVPLRASISLNISQQKITEFTFRPLASPLPGSEIPGTRPLTQAVEGGTLQGMADKQGKGDNWQAIAAANNIENPRLLQPGTILNLNLK